MSTVGLLRPLITGILHSFEPDHVTAISVLASENAVTKEKTSFKMVLKASQWALGHSVTLLLFGGLSLLFKTSLSQFVDHISYWADLAVGPIMLWLGLIALKRNSDIEEIIAVYKENQSQTDSLSINNKTQTNIKKPVNKSFWVGMVHGLAGTGAALTSALVLSAPTLMDAGIILLVESIGIVFAMGIYSYSLIAVFSRFFKKNLSIFKWMNGLAAVASIALGLIWIKNSIF